jgi:heme oxygenase
MNLREITTAKHKTAERMPFNQIMFSGKLTKEQYLEYLKTQYNIFQKIENIVELPLEFLRSGKIYQDIVEINNDIHGEGVVSTTTEISDKYCDYLLTLNDKTIWPHIYLNYLAILFGGQMIKSKVPGLGKMYDFENTQEIIRIIREKQNDEWADEVNGAYDYIINIFEELHKKTINV